MRGVPGTKYISRTGVGTFIVQKYINKKMVYFYHSKSLIECLMIRDLLEDNYWDKECLPTKHTLTDEKYIYKDHYGYSVKKYIDGKMVQFGYFTSLNDAIKERDLCVKYNWDFDALCNSPIENEQWLTGKFGKNQFHSPSKGRVDIRSW